MNRPEIDLVFGRGRLRMATGSHSEVIREASEPGKPRRYSKRFLVTDAGDWRHWTEREGRILARLASLGHAPVPRLEQAGPDAKAPPELVRTRDAGVTVDQWATLLPVQRNGVHLRHVFEDCAHWWVLARQCLVALDALHDANVVHLDLKADNVCVPFVADLDPTDPGTVMTLGFERLALIDFAFSLTPEEELGEPLPLAGESDYPYQSPRLLKALAAGRKGDLEPTRQLDWRCDVFSLAAMLHRYLPFPEATPEGGWTPWRLEQARALVQRLIEAHDADDASQRPHRALIALTRQALADAELSASARRGWTLAVSTAQPAPELATPATRIVMPAGVSAAVLSPPPPPPPPPPLAPPLEEHEWVSPAPPVKARAPDRRSARASGSIAAAAVVAIGALIGAGWWAMEPRLASERHADEALRAAADAVGTVPSLRAPAPASVAASAIALPLEVLQPVAVEALQPMPAPKPVASAAPSKAAARSRTAQNAPPRAPATAGPGAVNEAERKRALEWLTQRGAAPRPGMTMPPAPAPAPASAAKPATGKQQR